MAKAKTDEKDEADLDEAEASDGDAESDSSDEEGSAEERPSKGADDADDQAADDKDADEAEDEDAGDKAASQSRAIEKSSDAEARPLALKKAEGEEEEEEDAAAQLGTQRYVLAAFFAAGIVGAYVLGKLVHGVWAWAANKDWFHSAVPFLTSVSDDDKTTWGTVVGAIVAILIVIRTYRKATVRAWADEVATELAKVKWPTRKEVSSSTVVVIAAGAVATIYLALLDRLWSFVTDLFYGTGS